jgi:peptidoglycan/xylan/chitin deacetylase (PgdA/CDA1 family)
MMKRVRTAALAFLAATTIGWAASAISARSADASVPILLYHRFHPSVSKWATVTTPAFEAQLCWLAEHHYKVAPLASVVAALRGGAPLDPMTVVITADDGRRSQYTEMFPIVRRFQVPVTLFVYTHAIGHEPDALTWDEIAEMAQSGLVDVQSHTVSHPHFDRERARRRPADYEFFVAAELAQSKKTIEERLNRPVEFLAWPYGVFNLDLERAAVEAGYSAAFVVGGRPARAGGDLFDLPRIVVSDADRGDKFERLLPLGGGGAPVASNEPLASCAAHGAAPASS